MKTNVPIAIATAHVRLVGGLETASDDAAA